MAKEKTNLDQFFKEKLSQDSIKPSNLAWERLESQLPQKDSKRSPIIWWAAAASVGILFIVGYLTLQNDSAQQNQEFLAVENQELPTNPENSTPEVILETNDEEQVDTKVETSASPELQTEPKPVEKPVEKKRTIEKSTSTTPQNLIAQTTEKPKTVEKTSSQSTAISVEQVEVPALKMPNLQTNQVVAEVIEEPIAEEVSYSVKIYSDGIEEEKDKGLINEIGKKVEKVEGLLGKVDQGFADLQDAKNSLFTALLTKKEKVAEKP